MTEIEADVLTSGKCVKQRKMGTAETLGNPFTADYQEVPRRIPILIYSSTLCKYVIVLGNRDSRCSFDFWEHHVWREFF